MVRRCGEGGPDQASMQAPRASGQRRGSRGVSSVGLVMQRRVGRRPAARVRSVGTGIDASAAPGRRPSGADRKGYGSGRWRAVDAAPRGPQASGADHGGSMHAPPGPQAGGADRDGWAANRIAGVRRDVMREGVLQEGFGSAFRRCAAALCCPAYFCSTPPEAYFRPNRRRVHRARAVAVKAGRRSVLSAIQEMPGRALRASAGRS